MNKKFDYSIAQKGSMMVEALAMLGLITMVTPVLYKKAAERTTELQDINSAAQMRTISKALDDYIKDNYIDFTATKTPGTWAVDTADIESYLPYGFNLESSKLFDGYKMAIRRDVSGSTGKEHVSLTGMVVAPTKNNLPMIRSSKIASMIGANGSVYKTCPGSDGTTELQFCGVQGAWFAKTDDYDVKDFGEGSVASISIHAINASSGAGSDHVLFRDTTMGDASYNTMETTLSMGGWSIDQVHRLIARAEDGGEVLIAGSDEGEGAADANLVVQGAASISNLLTAGSANIASSFLVNTDKTVSSGGKVTITSGGLDVTGNADLKNALNVTGAATLNDTLTVKKATKTEGGLTATGTVGSGDGNTYSLVVGDATDASSLLVKKNARINGNMYIVGDFEASKVYGRVELGGGLIGANNYNFKATNNMVDIQGNNMLVGYRLATNDSGAEMHYNSAGAAGSAVGVNASSAYMQYNNANSVVAQNGSVTAKASGTLTAQGSVGKMLLDNNATVTGFNAYVVSDVGGTAHLAGGIAKVSAGPSGAHNLTTDEGGIAMSLGNTAKINLSAADSKIGINSENMYVDSDKLSFGQNAKSISVSDSTPASNVNNGVMIRRNGIINLARSKEYGYDGDGSPSGVDNDSISGYIKLDRVVSNSAYETPIQNGSYSVTKPYDSYQVNPAYTSVMHDIKLATRGGARLSDILPDFINKGIYVIDNTYAEPTVGANWEKYVVKNNGGTPYVTASDVNYSKNNVAMKDSPVTNLKECNTQDCITTPWLGFVPTPQCPPGYSKVITINPIRWKMSEAYMLAMDPTGEEDIAKKFKAYFLSPRNPDTSRFGLSTVNGSGDHTHEVASGYGMPLTFQTNTWLNTTISGVRENSTSEDTDNKGTLRDTDFMGWHAIMGFLYHGSDYQDYLTKVAGASGAAALNGKIVWNLFPVYNEEVTAIADVYCYFERRNMTGPTWEWKKNLVDTGYDQMLNFRNATEKRGYSTGVAGYDKNSIDYKKRLNDPSLPYNDPW